MSGGPLDRLGALALTATLFLLNPMTVRGAEPALPVFDLGSVVVTDTAPDPVTGSPVETTAEEAARQGDRDAVQMMSRSQGITISTGSKNEPEVLVRGFNQEKLLVLLDGVPITSSYQGDLDLSEIAVEDLARARVVKGNASPLYGPNALGGVIELVSGVPSDGPSLHLEALADDQDGYDLRGRHGFRKGPFYFVLSGGYSDHDEWELSHDFEPTAIEDGGARDWSAYQRTSAAVRVGGRWARGEAALSYRMVDAEKEIPVDIASDRRIYDFPTWDMSALTLSGRFQATDGLQLRGSLYRHTWDNLLIAYQDLQHDEVNWQSTYDDESWGAWLQGRYLLGDLGFLALGATFTDAEHVDQDDPGDPWMTYSARTSSLAASATLTPTEPLSVELALGYSRMDPVESALTPPGDTIDALDPVLALEWRWSECSALHASAGYRTRFPSLSQLYSDVSGNPDLDPERALNLDADYQACLGATTFNLGAFYSRIEDLIDRDSRDDPYLNRDDARIHGLELGAGTRLEPTTRLALEFHGQYTWTATRDGTQDDQELPGIPEHAARLTAGLELWTRTELELAAAYHGERYEYDGTDQLAVEDVLLLDATVHQELGAGFVASLRGRNLTDQNYEQEIGYPRRGRSLEVGLTFDLPS